MPSEKSELVTLSQVAQQVNEDKVKEIVVEGNDLTVILKEADKKEKSAHWQKYAQRREKHH